MVDQLDQIAGSGRRRWVLAIVFNILFWGMLALVGYVWMTHQGETVIPSVIASRTVKIKPAFPGKIKEITVEAADQFTSGQILFEIEVVDLLDQLRKTTESYRSAVTVVEQLSSTAAITAKLAKVDKEIRAAKNAIADTSESIRLKEGGRERLREAFVEIEAEYNRAKQAYEDNALPRRDFLGYRDRYRKARADLEASNDEIAKLEGSKVRLRNDLEALQEERTLERDKIDLTIRDREKERDSLKYEWTQWKRKEERLKHRAPFDGFVVRRMQQKEESVTADTEILELTDGKEIWVEAFFSPEDVLHVKQGDRLTVRYGDLPPFLAFVESIMLGTDIPPFWRVGPLTPLKEFRVVKLRFEDPQSAKNAGLVPGVRVETVMKRSQGLLYRLGFKKSPAPAQANEPPDQPTTATATSEAESPPIRPTPLPAPQNRHSKDRATTATSQS